MSLFISTGIDSTYLLGTQQYIQKLVHGERFRLQWGSEFDNDKCEKSKLVPTPVKVSKANHVIMLCFWGVRSIDKEVFLCSMTAISIKTQISVFICFNTDLICLSLQEIAHEKHASRDIGKNRENDSTEQTDGAA